MIMNPGFDDDVRPNMNSNNLNVTLSGGWMTDAPSGSGFNNIRVNGGGYGGGPDFANSGDQYLDLHGTPAQENLWQNFTLTSASNLTFSAYFSNRETGGAGGAERTATLGIYDSTGTNLLSSLGTVDLNGDATPSTDWTQSSVGSVSNLPAGDYQFRTTMGGYLNIDSVVVDAVAVPEPGASLLLLLGCIGLASSRRRSS